MSDGEDPSLNPDDMDEDMLPDYDDVRDPVVEDYYDQSLYFVPIYVKWFYNGPFDSINVYVRTSFDYSDVYE